MCRIGGLWLANRIESEVLRARLQMMARLQAHGGPDGEGIWLHSDLPLGLLHRRLAIIDLSPAGAQPMSRNTLTITYNGEIYNYAELRRVLLQRGYLFTSQSDTEVLLWGWHAWGTDLLPKLRGMFAFALWDGEALYLVRDRFGVKPLFYAQTDAGIVFASELPALLAGLETKPTLLRPALSQYLAYGFVRSPFTLYDGVYQVAPGHYLRVTARGIEVYRWWDPKPFFFGEKKPYPDAEVETRLLESFRRRLVADVPVGIFLSGGVDSSLVAALLAKHANAVLPTFTVGFADRAYDEAPWAEKIAAHLRLPSHVLYLRTDDLLRRVERLPELYGQPFGDASALAVEVLAEFARQYVKVALSADGGDELFGGYVRHQQSIRRLRWMGRLLRLLNLSPSQLARLLPKRYFHNLPSKLLKLHHFHGHDYGELVQAFPEKLVSAILLPDVQPLPYAPEMPWDSLSARQYLDLTIYLPDDVLQKVDRATMAHALEAREPFLDPEIVEVGGSLPDSEKRGKRILRRLLAKYLPPQLWQRPKQGFAPPLPAWLAGPLRERLRGFILSQESPLYQMGIQGQGTRYVYDRFLQGEKSVALLLWHLLILGLWGEKAG